MNAKIAALGRSLFALAIVAALASIPTPAQAATLTVNTTDDRDDGSCNATHCSLREAVNAANEDHGPDTITFNIPGHGPHVIHPEGTLWLSDDGTVIDGTTQPGYSPDPEPFGSPAVFLQAPTSIAAGRGGGPGFGLQVYSSGNSVRGLRLSSCSARGFGQAISLFGNANLVERNIIGLEPDGEVCTSLAVSLGGVANVIRDNVIVALHEGIDVREASPPREARHVIQGNYVGLDPSGALARSAPNVGISIVNGIGILIGGTDPGASNVIAGAVIGIDDLGVGTQVVGNLIGTNASGTAAVPNTEAGIVLAGEGAAVLSNVISGNAVGIRVGYTDPAWGSEYPGNGASIFGNLIGTSADGSAAIPNGRGIVLGPEAATVEIGSPAPSRANLISGNEIGIEVQGGSPVILSNRIGTDAAGVSAVPNEYGILVWDRAAGVQVGGAFAGEANLISGNSRTGLWLRSSAGVVQGNWFGLAADGSSALPNGTGLQIDGDSNRIGGSGPSEGNVASGNEEGIVVDGQSNLLLGNIIGIDPTGAFAIPNDVGIYLSGDGNTLGEAAAPNLISGNGRGLVITGSHNAIHDNRIGTDLAAAGELPNGVGIEVFGPYNQIGSGTLPGNQVLYNNGPGIRLSSLAVGNTIAGNTVALNAQEGIRVEPGGGVALNTFSQNSLYQNGWLGIDLLPGAQADVAVPLIDSITVAGETTAGAIRGHACPGCQVELFYADPDPSGSGEGRTFYAAGTAADSGAFTFAVPPGITLGICQPFTATATDTEGNTSEFSLNVTPFGCLHIPWVVIVLGVPGLFVVGALAGRLAGGPRGRPALGGVAGGAAGGLVGVVIALVLVRLPFVEIVGRRVPEQRGLPIAPVPPCVQFLNSRLLRPEDGAVFDLGTDVLFELSPQPDPPGVQTRWTLHLSGPAGLEVAGLVSTPSTSLSSHGVGDPPPGAYLWHLSAERLDAQTGDWNPFCADVGDRAFFLLQPTPVPAFETPLPEPPATTTVTPTPSPTPQEAPMATFLQNANCREGPALVYDIVTSLYQGQTARVDGRSVEGTWWWILLPGLRAHCWVAGSTVEVSGDIASVTVYEAPPEPVPACWVWEPQTQQNVCTSPCPPNAQPGGACTP